MSLTDNKKEGNKENKNEEKKMTSENRIKPEKTPEKFEYSKKIGNYILSNQIGIGTFSKVSKAIHIITNQSVAVKILEKEKIEDNIDIERIKREMEILNKIIHPNICQLYETYSTLHNFYLMMEYVEGGDLFDYITSKTFLSEKQSCYFYRQLISVIEYLNEMGISHRDIKPENILLDKEHKNIKLIDFGLSNYCTDAELLKSACGSPCYASPEMLSGKPYQGITIDLWSSGIVLYSMLVGTLPFNDQELAELYKQIKLGKFYLPSTLSLEAIDLLKRILQVDPKKRISLKEIKEHAWFKFDNNPMYKGIFLSKHEKIYVNKEAISYVIDHYYIQNKEISNEELNKMIEEYRCNKYTATYYLTKKYILKIDDKDKIFKKLEKNEVKRKLSPKPVKKKNFKTRNSDENEIFITTNKGSFSKNYNSNNNNKILAKTGKKINIYKAKFNFKTQENSANGSKEKNKHLYTKTVSNEDSKNKNNKIFTVIKESICNKQVNSPGHLKELKSLNNLPFKQKPQNSNNKIIVENFSNTDNKTEFKKKALYLTEFNIINECPVGYIIIKNPKMENQSYNHSNNIVNKTENNEIQIRGNYSNRHLKNKLNFNSHFNSRNNSPTISNNNCLSRNICKNIYINHKSNNKNNGNIQRNAKPKQFQCNNTNNSKCQNCAKNKNSLASSTSSKTVKTKEKKIEITINHTEPNIASNNINQSLPSTNKKIKKMNFYMINNFIDNKNNNCYYKNGIFNDNNSVENVNTPDNQKYCFTRREKDKDNENNNIKFSDNLNTIKIPNIITDVIPRKKYFNYKEIRDKKYNVLNINIPFSNTSRHQNSNYLIQKEANSSKSKVENSTGIIMPYSKIKVNLKNENQVLNTTKSSNFGLTNNSPKITSLYQTYYNPESNWNIKQKKRYLCNTCNNSASNISNSNQMQYTYNNNNIKNNNKNNYRNILTSNNSVYNIHSKKPNILNLLEEINILTSENNQNIDNNNNHSIEKSSYKSKNEIKMVFNECKEKKDNQNSAETTTKKVNTNDVYNRKKVLNNHSTTNKMKKNNINLFKENKEYNNNDQGEISDIKCLFKKKRSKILSYTSYFNKGCVGNTSKEYKGVKYYSKGANSLQIDNNNY